MCLLYGRRLILYIIKINFGLQRINVYMCTYSHTKPLATLLACLLDVDLRTDIESKLKHHLPVTLHKGNTCSGSSRKTHGRKKKSTILIVLKCHKYAPTVLIFYGNRKSIE